MAKTSQRTEVVSGPTEVSATLIQFFQNAKQRLDICSTSLSPSQADIDSLLAEAYADFARRGGKLRLLTQVNKDNAEYTEGLMGSIDIRHFDGVLGNFGISDSEYLATPGAEQFSPAGTLIRSSDSGFVRGQQAIFDMLWSVALPAQERVWELEGLIPPQTFKVFRSQTRTTEAIANLIKDSRKELLLLIPTPGALHRLEKLGVFDLIEGSARRGLRVKILAPVDQETQTKYHQFIEGHAGEGRSRISIMPISEARASITITILVGDKNSSLVIEEWNAARPELPKATGIAVYSTSEPTVKANLRFFERVREDTLLKDSETRNKRTAELMQDIMAHDIRNYNQVALLNAELALGRISDEGTRKNIEAIVRAIEGSTTLIQRTKTLGRIISNENIKLTKVSLKSSIERSISLARNAYPERKLRLSMGRLPQASVMADQLLDDALVNLLTNAIKYTKGEDVPIEIEVEDAREGEPGATRRYWKVTVSDHGVGIPDQVKEHVTKRYLETAKGSGLGLSIVRALIVDRYSGKVIVANRVKADYSQGTRVETWIPRAS